MTYPSPSKSSFFAHGASALARRVLRHCLNSCLDTSVRTAADDCTRSQYLANSANAGVRAHDCAVINCRGPRNSSTVSPLAASRVNRNPYPRISLAPARPSSRSPSSNASLATSNSAFAPRRSSSEYATRARVASTVSSTVSSTVASASARRSRSIAASDARARTSIARADRARERSSTHRANASRASGASFAPSSPARVRRRFLPRARVRAPRARARASEASAPSSPSPSSSARARARPKSRASARIIESIRFARRTLPRADRAAHARAPRRARARRRARRRGDPVLDVRAEDARGRGERSRGGGATTRRRRRRVRRARRRDDDDDGARGAREARSR